MALEALPDSGTPAAVPLISRVQGAGGVTEALNSGSSPENKEHLASILRMASLDANLTSGILKSRIIGKYSSSGTNIGHDAPVSVANLSLQNDIYFRSQDRNNMDPYHIISSSFPAPSSLDVPMNGCFPAGNFSDLCQGVLNAERIQHLGTSKASPKLFNLESHIRLESAPVIREQELGPVSQILRRPRYNINHETIQQQQLAPEVLLQELEERNPRLKALLMQHRLQSQLHQPVLDSASQIRGLPLQLPTPVIRNLSQEQSNQQMSCTPLLDGGICSRRFMQYLYHTKNRPVDNNITYWKKLVSEYFAPCSKKRWCFSTYENVEQHAAGVFCQKSMQETWCCDLCGSRLGKGLEATFDIFPRLFEVKFESGMLDETLFLDLPRARTLSTGFLLLEYGKAIQESVYERFRVVHEGKLRIVFRQDLKMLSWEFCAQKHEEFLLRKLVAPQVDQLLQSAQKYHNDIQKCVHSGTSSDDLQTDCDMLVSAGHQLARNVELPLVNSLGYPKRFIRCLQIAEVVNCMQDLIGFSHDKGTGPIESLSNYSQGRQTGNQMKEKHEKAHSIDPQHAQILHEHPHPRFHANGPRAMDNSLASSLGKSNLAMANIYHQPIGQNSFSSAYTKRRKMQESCSIDNSYQSRGSSPQSSDSRLHNAANPYSLPVSESSAHYKNPHEALVDKLLSEMVASSRGNSMQDTHGRLSKEAARQSYKNGTFSSLLSGAIENYAMSNDLCIRESVKDASAQARPSNSSKTGIVPKVGSHGNFSAVGSSTVVKSEPCSPENMHETSRGSKGGSYGTWDFEW